MLGIYTRISKEDKTVEGLSLENQQYRGIQLAKKLNLKYKVYEDAGKSGELSVDKRPKFKELFDDIKNKVVTAVYVLNQSRLDRGDLLQFVTIINYFKQHKIQLYYNEVHQDLDNTNTELTMNLLSVVNHNHNRQVAANISSAKEVNARNGKFNGGTIVKYGYRKGPGNILEIDEEEAEVIKLIFKLSTTGKGTGARSIARILNEKGILTRMAKEKYVLVRNGKTYTKFLWKQAMVYHMLKDTIYIGKRMYGAARKVIDAPNLAIITPELFEKTQSMLIIRQVFKDTTNKNFYLLKGLLVCGRCGRRYFGLLETLNRKTTYIGYRCSSGREAARCGNRSIIAAFIENYVCDEVLNLENTINTIFDDENFNQRNSEILKRSAERKERIKDLELQKDRLFGLFGRSKIKEEDLEKQIHNIDIQLDALVKVEMSSEKELTLINEKDRMLDIAINGVKEFKKLKTENDKAGFLINIISSINILYVDNEEMAPHYVIDVNFRFKEFENYLVSKSITIDRNGKSNIPGMNGHQITKVLSESVSLSNVSLVDENKIDGLGATVTFTKHLIQHTTKQIKVKKRK